MAETDKPVVIGGNYFPSVKKARQRLMERADEIVTKYLKMIDTAIAAGEMEVANDAFQFLIEHMPREDGESIIAESAAKPKQIVETGHKGPIIQIGMTIGGTSQPKSELQAAVIDVTPEREE